ncbi:zinc finger, CCHC-type containing protein, partial [Tanacetum coccineum]
NVEYAKELWDSLESKYMAKDDSSKKLFVKESLRVQKHDKGKGKEVVGPSVNMTEEGGKNKNNKQNKEKKRSFKDDNDGSSSNKKLKLECWKCGKTGHFKRDCHSGNKKNNASAGGHCWFKTYEMVEDGSVLYMGDDHFAPIHGKRSVVLEFNSGKSITLFNMLYVPKLRFVYYNNGMFMLNLNKVPDSSSVYMSSSIVVNSSLWHARLGHVHYKRLLEMSKDDLIPTIDENKEKCDFDVMERSLLIMFEMKGRDEMVKREEKRVRLKKKIYEDDDD